MSRSRWLQITSGRGPEECCWVVYQIVQCITKEAKQYNMKVGMLEATVGAYPQTFKSVLLSLEGEKIDKFLKSWEGSIQWIGKSPFRPKHKRKNWFIGIKGLAQPDPGFFSERDIKFNTMKASGPGGQHVNKSETAIRVKHMPSGLSAMAQEERSQHMNKKLALARLKELFQAEQNKASRKSQQDRWDLHNVLERGNSKRVYEGKKFRKRNANC
ncbi:MAG: peptide chain release factor H [Nitrospina sp.]|jgi:peptide chain release factor|nr:peptide chain release factor H [Nitrospina sp.]